VANLHIPDDLKAITDRELIRLLDRSADFHGRIEEEFCIRVGFLPDPKDHPRPNVRLVKAS
jgi:hypothetical protein